MQKIWADFRVASPTQKLAILADIFGILGISVAVFLAPFFAGIDLKRLDKYFMIVGRIIAGGIFMLLVMTVLSVFWTIFDESPRLRLFPRALYRLAAGGLGLLGLLWISYWIYYGVREFIAY